MRTQRVLSGMQPTGILHLGNYLGALQNWVTLQDTHECLYCVVDQHALTIPYSTELLPGYVLDAACLYMAAGVDPKQSILFVQSHVPEHTELHWYLSTIASLGQLERMTQFKDKVEQHGSAHLSLLAYPVLQAADILLYKTDVVPVGEDQTQHLELTRDLAQKFNQKFGAIFQEPQLLLTKGKRIPALDNQGKMSKSKPKSTSIFMSDTPAEVWEKLKPATTDPARKRRSDPGDPEKCPIGLLHKVLSPPETIAWVEQGCKTAGIGCIECKQKLAESIENEMGTIRDRFYDIRSRPNDVWDILRDGAQRARAIAQQTIEEVRTAMGLAQI